MGKLPYEEFSSRFCDLAESYMAENVGEMYNAVFGEIADSDSESTANWKMVIGAIHYAVRVSALTTAAMLDNLGLLDECLPDELLLHLPTEGLPQ